MTAQAGTLLEVREASVTYGGVVAVNQVSLTLEAGQLYGLIGPNGSGKTTMLGAISRLTDTSGGELRINGQPYTRTPSDRVAPLGIARTFQGIRLLRSLTVEENVRLGADLEAGRPHSPHWWLAGVGSRACEKRARDLAVEALDRVGLMSQAHSWPGELSYGVQRRAEIARALAMRPKLLLLDEPTAGMREDERAEITELATSLVADGITVVLVEHNVPMIRKACSYVYAMNFGNLLSHGKPEQVLADPAVRRAFLGEGAE